MIIESIILGLWVYSGLVMSADRLNVGYGLFCTMFASAASLMIIIF